MCTPRGMVARRRAAARERRRLTKDEKHHHHSATSARSLKIAGALATKSLTPAMAWVYMVVAINKGHVKEIIRKYCTYEAALLKLQFMNFRYYDNDVQDSFAIVVERA